VPPKTSAIEHLGQRKWWSGRWESNPRLKLGKLGYYHYTTPAQGGFYAPSQGQRKSTGPGAARRLMADRSPNPAGLSGAGPPTLIS
jgi:hypothetical protein